MRTIVQFAQRASALTLAFAMLSATAHAQEASQPVPADDTNTAPPVPADDANTAQHSPSTGLEEIIVTARKSRESLMTVPIAVSAVTGDTLDRNGLTALTQIDRSVPNLFILRNSIQPNLAIRGAYTYLTNYSVDSAVGISLDEVFIGSTRWIDAGQFDLAQIEVLKGPQGTYFGKNTTAGLINLTTRGPTDEVEGYVRGSYEFTTDEALVEGAVGGPITDRLGVRIAARYLDSKGFARNLRRDDREVSGESFVGRMTAQWEPVDDVTATYKVQREDTRNYGVTTDTVNCTQQFLDALTTLGLTDTCAFDKLTATRGSPIDYYNPFDQGRQIQKSWLHSLKVQADMGDVSVVSVTGYYDLKSQSYIDTTFSGLQYYAITRDDINRQFSQELRLQTAENRPLRLIVGGYFAHATFETVEGQGWDTLAARGIPLRFAREKFFKQSNDTLAVFGEVTWRITDALRLTAGGRVTSDEKKAMIDASIGSLEDPFDNNATAQAGAQGVLNWLPIPPGSKKRAVTKFTPAVTLQYMLPDGQVYASYKEGFKSGGFDSSISRPTQIANGFEFDDETAKSYEVGAKFTLLDGRLRLTAAAFRTDFSDLQLTALVPPATSLFLNAGGVRTQGVEFDGLLAVGGGVQLNLAAGYLDTKFTRYDGAPCYTGQTAAEGCVAGTQDMVGRQVAYAPKVSVSGGISWEGEVGNGFKLGLFADGSYRSAHYVDIDLDPLTRQKAVALFNGRISLGEADDKWRVSLIGRNLFNEDYAVGASDIPLFTRAMALNHGLPRTVMIQVETNF
jgi:Outer membrane receptor proteins, mostly Fe transport